MAQNSISKKPIESRREIAAQDKKERIIQAALELFAERGFHGTAVPMVAKRAGVGAGTIYLHFEHKEDLVNAVFRAAKNKLKFYLLESVQAELDIRKQFHLFWQNLVLFARENPTDFHFLELQDHAPYLDQDSKNKELEVLAPIWAMCVHGRHIGIIKDLPAECLMAMVWGAFVGLISAESMGYASATPEVLEQAEIICWQMLASEPLIAKKIDSNSRK